MDSNTTPITAQPKPRRRWHQFTLRTLLIVVTLAGCGLRWFTLLQAPAARAEEPLPGFNSFPIRGVSADKTRDANQVLFGKATNAELRELQGDASREIALRAAWERVLRTIPDKEQRAPVAVDAGELQRFVGFLEGRLGVNLPAWWEKRMLRARANRRSDVRFAVGPDLEEPKAKVSDWPFHRTDSGLWAPNNTALWKVGTHYRMTIDSRSVDIPASHLDEKRSGPLQGVTGLFQEQRLYLTPHSGFAIAYQLSCLEQPTGKRLWAADVWAEGPMSYDGFDFHCVALVIHDGRVLVFGMSTSCAYVEGFSAKDGRNEFRFSTSY